MDQLASILKVLSDKNRIRILKLLEKRKMCVCELTHILGITQPSVSRHLKKLKSTQLIAEEQDSLWTNYFLSSSESLFAVSLLKDLKGWLNTDKAIVNDLKKADTIDRNKLCGK